MHTKVLFSYQITLTNMCYCIYNITSYYISSLLIIVRMAKAAKRLQAILDYMKKVKLITSTVFGQFSQLTANLKLKI